MPKLSFNQIIEALKVGKDVKVINLCNQIGDEGAKVLAHALENNNTVTKIDLGYNHIGDEGAKALGSVDKNFNVTILKFQRNLEKLRKWLEPYQI